MTSDAAARKEVDRYVDVLMDATALDDEEQYRVRDAYLAGRAAGDGGDAAFKAGRDHAYGAMRDAMLDRGISAESFAVWTYEVERIFGTDYDPFADAREEARAAGRAEGEADKRRLDYLENELYAEDCWSDAGCVSAPPKSLFRSNQLITREVIDTAIRALDEEKTT